MFGACSRDILQEAQKEMLGEAPHQVVSRMVQARSASLRRQGKDFQSPWIILHGRFLSLSGARIRLCRAGKCLRTWQPAVSSRILSPEGLDESATFQRRKFTTRRWSTGSG